MIDPLTQYHALLRSTRASGYPNMQYMQPHPYEMAVAPMDEDYQGPFQYSRGWGMRQAPSRHLRTTRAFSPRTPYSGPQQSQQSSGRYTFLRDWRGGMNQPIAPQRQSRPTRDLSYMIP